jgi:hypothetical protein
MIALVARPFADLFQDPAQLRKVVSRLQRIIADSFGGDGAMKRAITEAEVKRRFAICEKWFRDLRGERKWTVDRCLDALPHALKVELSGGTYEPDRRSVWVPTDGAP